MRRVAQVASGPYSRASGRVVCCDSDHDSLPELIFSAWSIYPRDPPRIEVREHQGWNRFSLVFADTGEYPYPPGITTGNAIPFAAGDVDGDGLTDIVGVTCHGDAGDTLFNDVITIESPDSFSYPCSLSWYCTYAHNRAPEALPVYYPPDLDGDGLGEILLAGTWIWENTGNDSNELVWCNHECGFGAFGDFDMDGRMNLVAGGGPEVWENTGDNRYERTYRDTAELPPVVDVFLTNDMDRDGRPEFYVTRWSYTDSRMWLYMYEAQGPGDDRFTRTLVDSLSYGWQPNNAATSGDIDGDGIDECIWTTPDSIRVYKAVGDNDLRKVWEWQNDHGIRALLTTVYDVNGDGYSELIAASNAKISMFEVEAVTLLSPNGGSCGVGDTVSIRWVTNTPPRCDSLSLFLRRDSLWNLSTITTGLPGRDTLYRWVVPAGVPETARVVVIAYGPGWQFDMSDSVVTFIGGGVAEGTRDVPLHWSLSVSPNPARGAFTVRYDVPEKTGTVPDCGRVLSAGGCPSFLRVGIYDAGGRLVRSLCEGEVSPGRYEVRLQSGVLPAGVYFLRFSADGAASTRRATLVR